MTHSLPVPDATSLTSILKWGGTAVQVVGVFLLTTKLGIPWVAFSIGAVGNLAWCVAAQRTRDRSLLVVNLVFLVANLTGAANWH